MIAINATSNFAEVIDYVNQMHNQIQFIVSTSIQKSTDEIKQELFSTFGIPTEDISINFSFDGQNYKLSVEGINQYQLFNNTGYDLDYILNFIENKMVDNIQSDLNNAGYGYGN